MDKYILAIMLANLFCDNVTFNMFMYLINLGFLSVEFCYALSDLSIRTLRFLVCQTYNF